MAGTGYLLVLMIITCAAAAPNLSCEPAEVTKSYNLTYDVNVVPGNDVFVFHKGDDQFLASCDNKCICSVASAYDGCFRAYFMGQTIILNIINVTRQNEEMYSCQDVLYHVSRCNLAVYVRAESVSCQQPELERDSNNVKVMCTVKRIYPYPVCQFSWIVNGSTEMDILRNVLYHSASMHQGQADYFYVTCSVTLPAPTLGLGSHAFRVRVYPNVTGKDSDTVYGVNSSLTLPVNINYPIVKLESCPEGFVQEGRQISCTCRETANKFLPADTSFSQGSGSLSSGFGYTTYTFTASRNMTAVQIDIARRDQVGFKECVYCNGELICQGRIVNWTSNTVNYIPIVSYPESLHSEKDTYLGVATIIGGIAAGIVVIISVVLIIVFLRRKGILAKENGPSDSRTSLNELATDYETVDVGNTDIYNFGRKSNVEDKTWGFVNSDYKL